MRTRYRTPPIAGSVRQHVVPAARSRFFVALAATLVAAAPAAAELGIVGWYDTPTFPEEPELSSPRDAVVNGSGAGNAEPGDFYIANTGSFGGQVGQSINQYDVDGNRVRIFGEDVVASGPGSSNERQSVAIFAEGGTFTLSFGGEATAPLAYNATPATVEAALDALAIDRRRRRRRRRSPAAPAAPTARRPTWSPSAEPRGEPPSPCSSSTTAG